jgi:hypothetical protein
MRRAAVLLATVLLAGCGADDAIPDTDLALRVETETAKVEFGRAFPLEVVRVWRDDHVPAAWRDEWLDPLRLELVETERREDGGRIMETRRYRARAFETGTVEIPALAFRAKPKWGGPEVETASEPFSVAVTSSLPEGEPGPPEWPESPFGGGPPWYAWLAGAALAVGLGLLVLRRRRPDAEEPAAAAAPPEPTAAQRALRRLAALESELSGAERDPTAFYVALAGVVRDYLGERLRIPADVMTTPECVRAAGNGAAGRPRLGRVLDAADLVKFARHRPDADEPRRLLGEAGDFVRETSPGKDDS